MRIVINEAIPASNTNCPVIVAEQLIQQYHPDKVAALGLKLRAVAEEEGKRINKAYDMLRKLRGL